MLILLALRLLLHPLGDNLQSCEDLVNYYTLICSIDLKWLGTSLKHSHTIESGKMRLLVFLRYHPWLDTVEDHLIHNNSISQVNRFLKTKDTQDLQLHRRKIVQQVVEFVVFLSYLNSFINCNDQLIRFFDSEGSLSVHN
jgi:hypothetical protein